jgi:hypothetical protein
VDDEDDEFGEEELKAAMVDDLSDKNDSYSNESIDS